MNWVVHSTSVHFTPRARIILNVAGRCQEKKCRPSVRKCSSRNEKRHLPFREQKPKGLGQWTGPTPISCDPDVLDSSPSLGHRWPAIAPKNKPGCPLANCLPPSPY